VASRPLSRQRILKAAFALADKQGLDAVTMRSVAAKLDVEAMSLYHHVPNKQAMIDGLVDLLVQVIGLPTGEVSLEEWIRGAALGLRELATKHPRLVPLMSVRTIPLMEPEAAEPFEAGLAAFVRHGSTPTEAFAGLQTVLVSLLAMAQMQAVHALAPEEPVDETGMAQLDPDRFPLLRSVVEAPAGMDEFWSTLVDALVVGLSP
jgi:AcrR family transcriptional regulator